MTSRQITILVVAGFLTIGFAYGLARLFISMKEKSQKPVPPKIIRKVNTSYVEYADISAKIEASGRVLSQQSVDVISEVQGKILKGEISFKKGQRFNKNDILVQIYSENAGLALQARKSAFLNLLANILPDLKIDYPEIYEEWVSFFESISLKKDLPEIPEIKTNQQKIFLASKNILSEYYAIKSDEIQVKKYTIRAPYNGAIQDVLLEVGSIANPGSRIAQIIKTDELEVEVPIEVTDAGWLKVGDIAVLKTENGEMAGSAVIRRISPYVEENTQSINIYLGVKNRNQKLYPGEYLKIQFSGMQIEKAMEIPRNAVFNRNEVFVIKEGMLVKQQINLLKINENTIVFNGLTKGEEVVTEPLANATEGMLVQSEYTKPDIEEQKASSESATQ